jgi:hypothetical protein
MNIKPSDLPDNTVIEMWSGSENEEQFFRRGSRWYSTDLDDKNHMSIEQVDRDAAEVTILLVPFDLAMQLAQFLENAHTVKTGEPERHILLAIETLKEGK